MGTFLVFLLGYASHSESWVGSAQQMVQQMTRLLLVFLGLVTPVAPPSPIQTVSAPQTPVLATAKPDPNSMMLRTLPVLHHYKYLFEGKATFQGQPCANASVLVRLIVGETTVTKGTVTDADGSYSLETAIDAEDKAPVDWEMEAYTPDFQKVELSGRRIVQREEEQEQKPIIVNMPVEFLASLPK